MTAKAAEIIASCQNLPTIPGVALEVLRLARDPDVEIRTIAETISCDVALCARLLKVVNSSYYGLRRQASTVNQAIVGLGLNSVKTLALGFSLADEINKKRYRGIDLRSYWRRSLCFAAAARAFAKRSVPALREEAFIAGLLADIGTFAMIEAFGDEYVPLAIAKAVDHLGILDEERKRFDVDHQQVGRLLAQSWNLPQLLTATIANHHCPAECGDLGPSLVAFHRVIYVANRCAETFCGPCSPETIGAFERAAREHLGIEQNACRALVADLHTDIDELGKLLEINIPDSTSYIEIIHQANEELMRLSLEAQERAQSMEQHSLEAAKRLQELESDNLRLVENANCDPLTGLYNRRYFQDHFERELSRARRFQYPLSLLFVDVDHFKSVNDRHGHAAGDSVLRKMAEVFRGASRGIDCICRYGGEEFVFLVPETDLSGAKRLAERLRQLIADWDFQLLDDNQPLQITVSIGVATMDPRRPLDKELLIQMADQSLYTAKRGGRNRVCALLQPVAPAPNDSRRQRTVANP